jgi:predicted double-glycine peptidase
MNIKDVFAQNGLLIQEASYTCGPVSLLNILRAKGDLSYNEPELAKICNAKPGIGTSHEDLVKAAQKIGLELVEEKRDSSLKDIERNIDDGAFVIVNYSSAYSDANNGHYAVVTEYDEKAFYLRDCSYGFLRLKKQHLKRFWYGVDGIQQWYAAFK